MNEEGEKVPFPVSRRTGARLDKMTGRTSSQKAELDKLDARTRLHQKREQKKLLVQPRPASSPSAPGATWLTLTRPDRARPGSP